MEAKTPGDVRAWLSETIAQLQFEAKADGTLGDHASKGRLEELLSLLSTHLAWPCLPASSGQRLAALLKSLPACPPLLVANAQRLDLLSQAIMAAASIDRSSLPPQSRVPLPLTEDAEASLPQPACPACGESSTIMERLILNSAAYHRRCFRCSRCEAPLRPGLYSADDHAFQCIHHEQTDLAENLRRKELKAAKIKGEVVQEKVVEARKEDETATPAQDKAPVSAPSPPPQEPEFLAHNGDGEEPKEAKREEANTSASSIADGEEKAVEAELYPAVPQLTIETESLSLETSANPSPATDVTQEEEEPPKPESEHSLPAPPIAPPRRKRRSAASSPAPSPQPQQQQQPPTPAPKPKPPVPPKPVLSRASTDIMDAYPDDMNPFGSESEDEEEDYDDSLNPFASDLEEDDADSRAGTESQASSAPLQDSDTDSGRVTVSSMDRVKLRKPHPPPPPPPQPSKRLSLQPSPKPVPAPRQSMIQPGFKPSRVAPPPPPKPANKPTPSRKKRHAPPPPVPIKREIQTEELESRSEVEAALEKLDRELSSVESRGEVLERSLRDLLAEEDWSSVELSEWACLLTRRASLLHREAELVLAWRGHYLDSFHADIEAELRSVIEKPESAKTEADAKLEAHLLSLLISVIERKNAIVESRLPPAPLPNDDDDDRSQPSLDTASNRAEKEKKRKLKLRLRKVKRQITDDEAKKKEQKLRDKEAKRKEKEEKKRKEKKEKDSKKALTLKHA